MHFTVLDFYSAILMSDALLLECLSLDCICDTF